MFLDIDRFEHFYLSTTRMYMTLLMTMPMAIIKLVAMCKMYTYRKKNLVIAAVAFLVFFATLGLLRTQTLIDDEAYMDAMIPHHSSAITVSQEAEIKDPALKKLTEETIKAQEKEIAQINRIPERVKK